MKIKTNIYLNIIAFIVLLVSALSGFLLWLVIPKGNSYRGGRELLESGAFLGLDRHQWIDIHNYSSLVFVLLMILHLILHWSWIKKIPTLLKINNKNK